MRDPGFSVSNFMFCFLPRLLSACWSGTGCVVANLREKLERDVKHKP